MLTSSILIVALSVPTGEDSYSAPSDEEYQVTSSTPTMYYVWPCLTLPQAPAGEYGAPEESYGAPGRDPVRIFSFSGAMKGGVSKIQIATHFLHSFNVDI